MASTFSYTSLEPGEIRLLVLDPGCSTVPLSGSLITARLDPERAEIPQYEAISYTWGDQTNPDIIALHAATAPSCADQPGRQCEEIIRECQTISLGRNLGAALRQLRYETGPRVLWADSMCINQQDADERATQVRRMGDIFARAQRVVAWLGPEDAESPLAIRTLKDLAANIDFTNHERDLMSYTIRAKPGAADAFVSPSKDLPLSEAQWKAIKSLLQRSWFRRLWVRQELALAGADAICVVGDESLPWTHLSAALELIATKRSLAMNAIHISVDFFTARSLSYMRHQRDFATLVAFTHFCEATDPRDRVYGLLGLASGNLTRTIPIDYSKPVKKVYRDALSAVTYWHQSTILLSFCDSATKPTWIPDLDRVRHLRPIISGRAALATPVRAQNLSETHAEAYAIRCDVIAELLGPTGGDDSLQELWSVVVNAAIRYLGPTPEAWTMDKVRDFCLAVVVRDHELQPPFIDTLKANLASWVSELQGDPGKTQAYNDVQFLPFVYYLRGRCLYMTKSGCIALAPRGCQSGDLVCVFLGSNLPSVLHDAGDGTWEIKGPTCHPAFYEGEAIVGKLPTGWKMRIVSRVGNPVFEAPDGSQQRLDPRMSDIPLSPDWELRWTKDGIPFWYTAEEDRWTTLDPRLSMEELQKRGVEVERFVLT